jgi:hypothetical protein
VGGGDRLSEADLPDGLGPLAKLNSAQTRPDPDFHIDMTRLVRRLEEILDVAKSKPIAWTLTGEQRKQWRAAFISAFPQQPDLELMLEDELDESLNQITQGQPNYELAVRDLLRWAEAQGKLPDLLTGALSSNPGNPKLQELVSLWLKP